MVYFDNAATSFPKPRCVIKAVNDCILNYCANSGRSAHVLADKTGEKIFTAREAIADFLSFPYPENVCFTTNATYALNIAIKTLVPKGSHVLISDMEHNSVLRPVYDLSKQKLFLINCRRTSFWLLGNCQPFHDNPSGLESDW